MKKIIFIYLLVFCFCQIIEAGKITKKIDVLVVTYSGEGDLTYSATTDYKYDFKITGMGSTSSVTKTKNKLTIKPINKSRNSVYINSITADGPLNSINITLPPGKVKASCVRNISVNGYVNSIKITGGNLGDSEAKDGYFEINGYLNSLMVQGKKYNVPKTKTTEWWGGNIWSTIFVDGNVKKIMVKGGNISYYNNDSLMGLIYAVGDLSKLSVSGVIVKTNRADSTSKVLFGGGIGSQITCENGEIKSLIVKGGAIKGSYIYCNQLGKVQVIGQSSELAGVLNTEKGISKTLIEVTKESGDYKLSSLKNLLVKNGTVKDSIFSVKGNLNSFKVVGEADGNLGNVFNTITRVGYQGNLSESIAPKITTDTIVTNIGNDTTLVVKFEVENKQPGTKTYTRIRYRDLAYNSFISNYNGEIFSPDQWWETSETISSGMFVWTVPSELKGAYLEPILIARNDGIPYLAETVTFGVAVDFTNLPPTVSLDPSYNPISFDINASISWTCTVYDVNSDEDITLSVTGPQDFNSFNITEYKKRHFLVKSIQSDPKAGTYDNVTFKAKDSSGLETSKIITVNITTNDSAFFSSIKRNRNQIRGTGIIPFPGKIGQINVIGNVNDSLFAAGTKDTTPEDWKSAEYLGKISGVNIKGTAVSNTFVSQKKISIPKSSNFDFTKNIIWIDGKKGND